MPIDLEEFEVADDDFFRGESELRIDEVFQFLAFNPDKAYSRREMQSSLEISAIELVATLSHLENMGLVRHKGQYWTIAEDVDPEGVNIRELLR